MIRLLETIVLFTIIYKPVLSQTLQKVCEQRLMYNGAGFIPHPTDCDKFIQCYYNSVGVLQGVIRQCAFATYWDDDSLTCGPANGVICHTDRCANQSDSVTYQAVGNCRGYWVCEGGRSVPLCCPRGQTYSLDYGVCILSNEHDCHDSCFNDRSHPGPGSGVKMTHCDKQPVRGNPSEYVVTIGSLFTRIMPCPVGTRFDINECGCVYDYDVNFRKRECKPELHLTFDTDEMDQSGNGNHVFNQNVVIENGVAKFNGVNSRLIIPRFSNIEHTDSVVIKIKYSSNHKKSKLTRAIVSNSDCLNVPSIMLCEDDVNTYYGVSTTRNQFVYTHLPHHEKELSHLGVDFSKHENDFPSANSYSNFFSEKKLEYKFADGKLTGMDGYNITEMPVQGHLRNVHCALHVGYAEVLAPFEGEIDDLQIFLCNSDEE